MKWLPSVGEVAREAVIVVAGALVAAWVVGQLPPEWRKWLRDQWTR